VKRIAFVTCSSKPDFAPDDHEAVNALTRRGAHVQAIPWDNDFSDWNTFDRVILRSCWNYHLHPVKFLDWLNELERRNVKVYNPIDVIRWNLHKSYLEELSRQGVALPETIWLKKHTPVSLSDILSDHEWEKAVVKPAISATAYKTILTSRAESKNHEDAFNELLQEHDILVQEFIPEVKQGEWSLIFFNKKFSHAVLKRPKADDFRVQDDFGGTVHSAQASEEIIKQAEKILALISGPLIYTRIDGIIVKNQFYLMELELIEPVLFFKQEPEAAVRFADHILEGI
jgi:glutathione synthase/RimK-type ligase-like ATP-grasp enzyme